MKNLYKLLSIILLSYLLFGISACNLLRKNIDNLDNPKTKSVIDSITSSTGRNLTRGLSDTANNIGKRLGQGLIKGLEGSVDKLDPDIKKIMKTIDSLGNLSNAQLQKIGDSLHSQLGRIKNDINDKKLKKSLIDFLETFTGTLKDNTKNLLSNMVQNALDSLSGKSSKAKIDIFVHNLLSDTNAKNTQKFLDASLKPTIDTLADRIDKIVNKVHGELDVVHRNAWWFLSGLGLLACGIIGFVWYQRRKYAKLLKIMTYQIHAIPSKDSYDNLTQQIQSQAQKDGLEPLLRSTLKEQGINH